MSTPARYLTTTPAPAKEVRDVMSLLEMLETEQSPAAIATAASIRAQIVTPMPRGMSERLADELHAAHDAVQAEWEAQA